MTSVRSVFALLALASVLAACGAPASPAAPTQPAAAKPPAAATTAPAPASAAQPTQAAAAKPGAATKDTMTIVFTPNQATFDAHFAVNNAELLITRNIYNALLKYK